MAFWDGASDGDGDNYLASDPLNWSTNQVPGPGDQVHIDNWNGNIGFLAGHMFGSLHYNSPGATIQGGGSVTVNGTFDWKAGGLFMTGTLTLQGTSQFNANPGQALRLNAQRLINNGTLNWTRGEVQLTNGATITNIPGGLFSIQVDANITTPRGRWGPRRSSTEG